MNAPTPKTVYRYSVAASAGFMVAAWAANAARWIVAVATLSVILCLMAISGWRDTGDAYWGAIYVAFCTAVFAICVALLWAGFKYFRSTINEEDR